MKLLKIIVVSFFLFSTAYAATRAVNSGHAIAKSGSFIVTAASDGTVTLFKENDGDPGLKKLDEVKSVGGLAEEARQGVVQVFGSTVFVARGSTITVFQIKGSQLRKIRTIPVGLETHGLSLSPNGTRLYATSLTEDKVYEVDAKKLKVIRTIAVTGHPLPVVVTNDGDKDDTDERVFVGIYFSRLITGRQEGTNNARQGIVATWAVNTPGTVQEITLAPVANVGFTKNIQTFCAQGTNGAETFCNAADIGGDQTAAIEGGFPNFLRALAAKGNYLYVYNTGASPAPPIEFDTNVQAFVNVVNIDTLTEDTAKFKNLNTAVIGEGSTNFQGLFLTDISSVGWVEDDFGTAMMAAVRNGGFLVRVPINTTTGAITIAQPIARYPVGHMPEGTVFSGQRQRHYTFNNIGKSVTISANPNPDTVTGDEVNQTLLTRDVSAGDLPKVGSREHQALVGWLLYITGLGIPNDNVFKTPIRAINTLANRGKASNNNWSSCASCHGPYGLTDNVTWIFATGPRQTVPMDQSVERFSRRPTLAHATNRELAWAIMNYSDVQGSTTDFNNNSRNVQGGTGHQAVAAQIFNHGPVTTGVSEALRSWLVFTELLVRPLDMPRPASQADFLAGRQVFIENCASCHGGGLWTISDHLWGRSDPSRTATTVAPVDANLNLPANANQVIDFQNQGNQIIFRKNVGTFDATDFRERIGIGATVGQSAVGSAGYGVPSLQGIGFHAPYLHHGDAQTLAEVFAEHMIPNEAGQTITAALSAADRAALITFLNAIDKRTPPVITNNAGTVIPENEIFRRATGCPLATACNP